MESILCVVLPGLAFLPQPTCHISPVVLEGCGDNRLGVVLCPFPFAIGFIEKAFFTASPLARIVSLCLQILVKLRYEVTPSELKLQVGSFTTLTSFCLHIKHLHDFVANNVPEFADNSKSADLAANLATHITLQIRSPSE